VLHEHETALSAERHANRSRRLIKCAKESARYPDTSIPRIRVACELDRDRGKPLTIVSDSTTWVDQQCDLSMGRRSRAALHYIAPGKPV
jgi:hypothetical protein